MIYKGREVESVLGVRFLDCHNQIGNKTYYYFLDEKLTKLVYENRYSSRPFNIVNENGYDYRDSAVFLVELLNPEDYTIDNNKEYIFLKEIIIRPDINPKGNYERKLTYEPKSTAKIVKKIHYNGQEYELKNDCSISNDIERQSKIISALTPVGEASSVLSESISSSSNAVASAIADIAVVKNNYDELSSTSSACNCASSISAVKVSPLLVNDYNNYYDYNTLTAPMTHFDSNGITISGDLNLNYEEVYDKLEKVKEEKNRKESKKMFEKVMKNFEFGKCGNNVKMSVYGPAFKDYDGNYIAFNGDEAMDVTGMTFDFDCFYKMPVAQDDVEIGDYVYHLSDPVKVVDVTERGSLVCVRLFSHEEVTVVPIKNMFGFNFFTKLVNFGEGLFGANTIDKSNPFGSMLPLFLMSKGGKNDNLMMAMMMSQGNLDFKSNPLMMMALMGENKSEMLPLLMMSQMAPKHSKEHKCDCCKCNKPDEV